MQHSVCNNVYKLSTKKDIVNYLHASCFSPVTSTQKKTIQQGHFATWLGLDETLVQKHLERSVATTKGHMKQQRMNLHSTQPKKSKIAVTIHDDDDDEDPDYDLEMSSIYRTNEIVVGIVELHPGTGNIFADLTGCFPM
eukprot:5431778-Ditylum_brightwellii.AAC.1